MVSDDGLLRKRRHLGEDRVLSAIVFVIPHQTVYRGGRQRFLTVPLDVVYGHKHLQRLVFHELAAKHEHRFDDIVGVGPLGDGLVALALDPGVAMPIEQSLPVFNSAWNVRFLIGADIQPGDQQLEVGIRSENRPCRPGAGRLSSHGQAKPLQSFRLGQICERASLGPRKRVEVRRPSSRRRLQSGLERTLRR